jgi:hypothetical protein
LLSGHEGLRHDDLTNRVFDAIALPVHLYAADPAVKFAARQETDRALRDVLGYRMSPRANNNETLQFDE